MLTITEITNRDEWNALLRTMPYPHVLQTWEWGQFKYETTGWLPHRWAFRYEGEDEVVGLCSMGERKIGPFSVMYAPKGPAIDYDDPDVSDDVLDLLQAKAREHNAIWLKIDPDIPYATGIPGEEDYEDQMQEPGDSLREGLPLSGWRFSDDQVQFRNTITIDLKRSENAILAAMSGNTRRKVRTAAKQGVSIRPAGLDDLDTLYDLYAGTGERNEFLIRPAEYYQKLWREFMEAGLAHALIAEYEGKPLAHVILFHFGQTCWYFYGASSEEERQRMPTYALQWEAMKWAKAQGYSVYDLWGAPNDFTEEDPMWDVFVFKRGFRGTVERRLGAWDYAPNPLLYAGYTQLWPRLRAALRKLRT